MTRADIITASGSGLTRATAAFLNRSLDDFLTGYLENYFLPMDPNNLLCMIGKWQASDVSRLTGGDLKEALSRVKAKTFVVAIG
jgi:homoserine acetyltransferase